MGKKDKKDCNNDLNLDSDFTEDDEDSSNVDAILNLKRKVHLCLQKISYY